MSANDDPFDVLGDIFGTPLDPPDTSGSTFDEVRMRELLPHVWHPFFGRFGRLTDAQIAAIEPIVRGKSVVLCAATASGKTEALLAPMIERCMAREPGAPDASTTAGRVLRVIVVCPTRALCNDFLRRVRHPIHACRWSFDVKSGDSPEFDALNPPEVLITTPESLDSLLSRKPASLRWVDALFLDEIHLLDGSARGDHVRVLVSRLKNFRPDLQVCCASATAAQAKRLGAQFVQPRNPSQMSIVTVEGGRDRNMQIDYLGFESFRAAAQHILDMTENHPGIKLLVFANRRREVEWLTGHFRTTSDQPVFAHHGSLARAERLRSEKGFLQATHGICVATMTLELGIDIGDVDRVVLLNPPANVASFSQRIGRSNRRGGDIQVSCLYSTPFDLQRFEHLAACARAGKLFVEEVAFRPSVLVQQAISLLFQNRKRHISATELHNRLPPDVAAEWTRNDCRTVLENLREAGYFHANARGQYVADEPAQRAYRLGQMHTHIEPDPEVEVIDEMTGQLIGTAEWDAWEQPRASTMGDPLPTENLMLAGRRREVTRVRDRRVYVQTHDDIEEPSFCSRMGPRYSFDLAQDLARFIGLPDGEIRLTPLPDGKWFIEHFFGSTWGKLLGAVLLQHGFGFRSPASIGPFKAAIAYRELQTPPTSLGSAAKIEATVQKYLQSMSQQLIKSLQPGPWSRFIPADMTLRWLTDCTRPAEFADTLAAFRLVVV